MFSDSLSHKYSEFPSKKGDKNVHYTYDTKINYINLIDKLTRIQSGLLYISSISNQVEIRYRYNSIIVFVLFFVLLVQRGILIIVVEGLEHPETIILGFRPVLDL